MKDRHRSPRNLLELAWSGSMIGQVKKKVILRGSFDSTDLPIVAEAERLVGGVHCPTNPKGDRQGFHP